MISLTLQYFSASVSVIEGILRKSSPLLLQMTYLLNENVMMRMLVFNGLICVNFKIVVAIPVATF